jgi:hypothetical protein
MLKYAASSVGVTLRYARTPALMIMLAQLVAAFEAPLVIFFTGKLINGVGAYVSGAASADAPARWTAVLT